MRQPRTSGKRARLSRPSWDIYYMDIARVVAQRGNCIRRQVAAVIVKDNRLISTGYNGTPRGVTNCCDGGCARCAGSTPSGKGLDECVCSHAEENSITQAAYHGIRLAGSTLYSTLSPCLMCAKMIINAGIETVIYDEPYKFSKQIQALFREAGVSYRKLKR